MVHAHASGVLLFIYDVGDQISGGGNKLRRHKLQGRRAIKQAQGSPQRASCPLSDGGEKSPEFGPYNFFPHPNVPYWRPKKIANFPGGLVEMSTSLDPNS